MAERTVAVRLTVRDAEVAARALRQFGDRGSAALKRLETATAAPTRGLQLLDRASGGASARLQQMGQVAAFVDGPLGGVASRFAVAGSLAGKFGVAMAGVSLAVGGTAFAIKKMVDAGEQFEKRQLTTIRLLEATGTASGKTAADINKMAVSIGDATLASTDGVRAAANQLLTFRAVSGETFDRTLRLAQDLAAVGFGSIESATRQLGKALEDPVRGLASLREVGVSFTADQQKLIKSLTDSGRQAEAMTLILDVLEQQVGGAGEAEAGGLSGAFDSLYENTTRWLEYVAQKTGVLDLFTDAVKGLAGVARDAADSMTPEGRLADVSASIEGLRPRLSSNRRDERMRAEKALADLYIEQRDIIAELDDLEQGRAFAARQGAAVQKEAAESAARAKAEEQQMAEIKAAVAKIEKSRAAVRQREEAERTAALKEIEGLEASAAAAGLDGEAALAQARDAELARWRERLDEQLIGEADFQRARLAIEEEFQKERDVLIRREAERQAAERERKAEAEQRKIETEAKRQAEIMQRPFLNALDSVQDSFADTFRDIFEGGEVTFKSLAGRMKSIMANAAAEIAAVMVFRPIIANATGFLGFGGSGGGAGLSGVGGAAGGSGSGGGFGLGNIPFSSFLGDGFTSAIDSFGVSLGFGSGVPAELGGFAELAGGAPSSFTSASLSGVLGAAGLGFLGGSFLASLTGGNPTTGGLGGGAGAGIGFALGGPVGGIVGGLAGSLFGGMFGGGKPSVGPNAGVEIGVDPATGRFRVTGGGADNGGDTGFVTQLAGAFSDAAAEFAAAVGDPTFFRGGGNTFSAYGATGQIFYNEGKGPHQLSGTDPEDLLERALLQRARNMGTLSGHNEHIDPLVRQVLQRSEATTATGLLDDIKFAQALAGIEFGDPVELTRAEQAITAINEAFDEARDRALKLGLAEDQLIAARERALEDLEAGFAEGIERQILAFTNPLELAMAELADAQENRLREAEALGADLVAIEQLHGLERAAVIDRFAGQATQTIAALLGDLDTVETGGASPLQAYRAAQAAFLATGAGALAGDGDALAGLAAAGRQLLDLSRGVNASGGGFQSDLSTVRDVLEGVLQGLALEGGTAAAGAGAAISAEQLGELGSIRRLMTDNNDLADRLLKLMQRFLAGQQALAA